MRRLFFGLYGEKYLFRIIAVRFGGVIRLRFCLKPFQYRKRILRKNVRLKIIHDTTVLPRHGQEYLRIGQKFHQGRKITQ